MNRLLRKYNRILLAVFGVGLMIVFLMPQLPDIVQQLGGSGSQIATMGQDGEPVSRRDWQLVQQQVQTLQRLQSAGVLPALPMANDLLDDPERYFLLIHEADQAGMIGGAASAGLNPDSVLNLSTQTGMPPAVIRQALINYSGISRYLNQLVRSGAVSDRRMRLEARRMLDSIDTRFAVLPAEAAEDAPQADEAALQAHFDTWKDTEPGEGDHGFGYRLPDRAAIEWLQIPRAHVETAIRAELATDDLPARKYWRTNATRLNTPVDGASEVPENVVDAWVADEVDARLPAISRAAGDVLRAPRRGFTTREGFVVLPDDWSDQRISLADLRASLIDQFGLSDTLPAPQSTDGLLDLTEIRKLDGVGLAGTDRYGPTEIGARTRRLADLVSASREFGGLGQVPVQEGMAGPVLEDPRGNLWIFRVTRTDQARPPAELDEVRTQVIADTQTLAHWQAMQSELDELETLALTDGVSGVAETYAVEERGPQPVRRYLAPGIPSPARVPGLGTDEAVIDAIVERSIALGEDPIRELAVEERVLVVPSEKNMAFVVVELDRRQPMTLESYRRYVQSGSLPLSLVTDELGGRDLASLNEAFTGDALRQRHNFKRAGGDEQTEDVADASDAAQ